MLGLNPNESAAADFGSSALGSGFEINGSNHGIGFISWHYKPS